MGRAKSHVKRDKAMAKVKEDEKKLGRGARIKKVGGKYSGDTSVPGSLFKLPKVVIRETTCCLDKPRLLPQVFRICIDCPKRTEAGFDADEVVAKTRGGSKATEAGSKTTRGKKSRG